ncbi:putative membrane protein [Paenibacillus phyllosphaerae]|uniref:Putative membrane protein n=1 Tax=Paenibacillus phyllosphaerae TaxID=274593 RepID=A0A7W5FNE7_9BACL|nr:immunoglobulin-like domain-containing protein [Paenibacillus phyllosphaerae]MBB3111266.1 putative membrane protein [Paenibacillus phyllosphaerae]
MRKWFIGLLAAVMLVSGGSAAAAHNGNGNGNGGGKGNGNGHGKQYSKYCQQVLASLNEALAKANNEKSKEAIRKYIASVTAQCDGKSDQGLTDDKRVQKDKEQLQVRYRSGDSVNKVTGPVVLVVKGQYGSTISWKSSASSVISDNGLTVMRQSKDTKVTLTATIKYNKAVQTKSFVLTVKAADQTDAQRVAKDKAALKIEFNGSDNINSVTQPLKLLPTKGQYGSTIKWYSGDPNTLSADGKTVKRPSAGEGDAIIPLTAVLQSGNAVEVVTFKVTVKAQLQDANRVSADKAALEIDFAGTDNASRVTRPLDNLPVKGVNGSAIVWTSSMPSVLSNDGKTLHRPAKGEPDVTVLLTAIITSGSASDVKIFVLTIKADLSNAEKVAADKAELQITFASDNSANSVTKPITLPSKGAYGSTITWYSNSPGIISDNGKTVNRPADGEGDAKVTMMAFVTYDGVSDLKTFTLTVKEK